MDTMRETDRGTEYRCPICKEWYTWAGNFRGLMLADAGEQPFVCKNCEAEGERRNKEAYERFEARNAPFWEAARERWPKMVDKPSIYPMRDSEAAYEIAINHLDTGLVEYELNEPIQVGPYRMAYSTKTHSLAVWGYWQSLQPEAQTEHEMMDRALRDAGYMPIPNEPPKYTTPEWLREALERHARDTLT